MLHIMLSLDTESLIRYGGIVALCLLMFCAVGLFFCFFLPVGGILFTAGMLAATGDLLPDVSTVCLLLVLSSVAGSVTGYGIGRSAGNFLYTRRDSRFFRRSYLISTETFYKKHGNAAMIAGYFLPIIRSFAPLLAGIIKADFRRFLVFNVIGSALFILFLVLTGHAIGSLPFLQPWLKHIVAFFVLAVTIPIAVKIVRIMRKPGQAQ